MASSQCNDDVEQTYERVLQVLKAGLYASSASGGAPTAFIASNLSFETTSDGVVIGYTEDARARRARSWYKKHVAEVAIQADHYVDKLDECHNHLIQCNFRPKEPDCDIARRVCRLLRRLPATSSELGGQWDIKLCGISPHHFQRHGASKMTWDTLHVTNFMATNTIRLAIQMELNREEYWGLVFRDYINTLADLLEAALDAPDKTNTQAPEELIVQAFLWTCWQRATMLQMTYILRGHLQVGYDFSRNDALSLKVPRSVQKVLKGCVPEVPQYMCRWAFESIHSDRAAVALDFRAMMARFEKLHGGKPPRCVEAEPGSPGGPRQCSGQSPGTCNRFVGRKIQDQSAHTTKCAKDCPRLTWNEQSYRSGAITGARAVRIDESKTSINYCAATVQTLAVSHVWSHGQGGRPEAPENPNDKAPRCSYRHRRKAVYGTGFNQCLHRRYCEIARSLGCDSYWMDTPCIPQDHKLRREAIMNINAVFANSMYTLVCDADLMQIDVSEPTTELMESILATLLVCDWNVRAWTLLESMRGRKSILLLCKNKRFIPLRDIVERVLQDGSIALVSLFATAQHMLPAQLAPDGSADCAMLRNRTKGFVSAGEAACLLSHRHASRPNDEVIIWSLLCGESVQETPVDFWRQRIDSVVPTGLLVSSAPRISASWKLSHRGFGWAPSRPNMPTAGASALLGNYYADDGSRSETGLVKKNGLRARWLLLYIPGGLVSVVHSLSSAVLVGPVEDYDREVRNVSLRFLKGYIWGALLQVKEEIADRPIYNRTGADGTLLAVVGSHDRRRWHWRGVYEWNSMTPLPQFFTDTILLV